MAIGALIGPRGTGIPRNTAPVAVRDYRGLWLKCHDDLTVAEAAADLLKPWNVASAEVHWIRIPDDATGVYVGARQAAAVSAVTTSPIVRLYGATGFENADGVEEAIGDPNSAGAFSGTITDANFAAFNRLDNLDANAAGLTLALATTTLMEDGGFEYSDLPSLVPYSTMGHKWFGMLVETAANVTGGAVVGLARFVRG